MTWRFFLPLIWLLSPTMLLAQQPPAPPRTLLHADLDGIPGQETLIQIIDIPPGASTPRHIHPDGHEIAYVLQGDTTVEIDGVGTRSVKEGELIHVRPNVPHLGRNPSASAPLRLLVVRIKDKSKPIMIPVK